MGLYEDLVAAGIETANHASDLYFPVTEQSTQILKRHPDVRASVFTSNVDGKLSYDAPFQYQPWWDARSEKEAK